MFQLLNKQLSSLQMILVIMMHSCSLQGFQVHAFHVSSSLLPVKSFHKIKSPRLSSSKLSQSATNNNNIINTISSKYYQLEEMEDKESCTTELFLSHDGTVSLSDTNGPLPIRSSGSWQITKNGNDENQFEMKIVRTYGGGQGGGGGGGIGEFTFDVERIFVGLFSEVGGLVNIEGSMHLMDEFKGDMEVGFFSMIDTTEDRLKSGGRIEGRATFS